MTGPTARDELRVQSVLADVLCRASFGDFTTDDMERIAHRQVVALRRSDIVMVSGGGGVDPGNGSHTGSSEPYASQPSPDAALAAARSEAPGELDADLLAQALEIMGDGTGDGYRGAFPKQYAANLAREYRRLREDRS